MFPFYWLNYNNYSEEWPFKVRCNEHLKDKIFKRRNDPSPLTCHICHMKVLHIVWSCRKKQRTLKLKTHKELNERGMHTKWSHPSVIFNILAQYSTKKKHYNLSSWSRWAHELMDFIWGWICINFGFNDLLLSSFYLSNAVIRI